MRVRNQLYLVTFLAIAFLTARSISGQQAAADRQQRPVFRAEVNYVEVDVRATDSRGNFVRDLRREDFEVLEDGKPQEISTFSLVDLPYDVRPALSPVTLTGRVEPDVRSNAQTGDARVFVILLDDLHTHPLRSARVKEAAQTFIERYIGSNDLVSVLHASGRSDASQDFTTNTNLLLASVDKFMGRKLQSATRARVEEYHRQRGQSLETRADQRLQRVMDPLDLERGRHAENLLQTMERLANVLADARGRRKAVVLIGEGIDYEIQNDVAQTTSGLTTFTAGQAESVIYRLGRAIGAMTRANVAVYGVDPRGVVTSGDDLIEVGSFPENPLLGLSPMAFQQEVQRAHDSLKVISEQTGGFATVNTNDLDSAFERVVRDSSTYYLLGYYSKDARADGRYRKIEVRVRRPGVEVRARRGYRAPTESEAGRGGAAAKVEASAALRDVLGAPLPVSDVPLHAFAAAFKGEGNKGSVLLGLEMEARNFKFDVIDGLHADRVESAVVAMNEKGDFLEGDGHTVDLRLKPQTYQTVLANGMRLLFRLALPPGRYQLRAAVHETGSGAVGSVYYDVTVPDFAKAPLALSGLVLSAGSAAAVPTPRPDPDLAALLRQPPTAARDFRAGETLAAAFAVYQNPRNPGAVDLTTTVADESGTVRFTHEVEASEADLRGAPNGLGYVVEVPLDGLPPGRYVLKVRARSRLSRVDPIERLLPFSVRAAQATLRPGPFEIDSTHLSR